MRTILICLMLLVDLGMVQDVQQQTEEFGAIQGRVVDAGGNPVEGAKVTAEPEGPMAGILPEARTNDKGEFSLGQVPAGATRVFASKVDDYYPEAQFSFYATDISAFPRINVLGGETITGLEIRLTVKGARLVVDVLDSATKEPILTARIRLWRPEDPKVFVSTSPDKHGHREFVVPSRPFLMEVTAPGYKTWSAIDESGHPGMWLQPETTKQIEINLKKLDSPMSCSQNIHLGSLSCRLALIVLQQTAQSFFATHSSGGLVRRSPRQWE